MKKQYLMAVVVLVVQGLLLNGSLSALPTTVFTTDFETGVPSAFSTGGTSAAGIGPVAVANGLSTYLGRFTTSGATTLSLTGLPAHTMLELEFDAYLFNTWDGDNPTFGKDSFSLSGGISFSETFTNHQVSGGVPDQTFPTGPDVYLNSVGTALSGFGDVTSTMAYFGLGATSTGSSFLIPHTGSTFSVTFGGPVSQTDEQWGIDNVLVAVDMPGGSTSGTSGGDGIPEPITATLGLFGLGVLGVVARRRQA